MRLFMLYLQACGKPKIQALEATVRKLALAINGALKLEHHFEVSRAYAANATAIKLATSTAETA